MNPEGITVIGDATHHVPPDTAELTLGVQTTGASAAQAVRDNAGRMLNVVQAVLQAGISQADLRTGGMTVLPLFPQPAPVPPAAAGFAALGQPAPQEVPSVAGFHVTSSVKAILRETNRVGEVMDAAVGAGANFGLSVTFGAREEAVARRAVLDAAARDARVKAEALAAVAGKQLGDAVAVLEEFSFGPACGPLLGAAAPAGMPPVPGPQAGLSGTPLTPGELCFSARVRVVYALR